MLPSILLPSEKLSKGRPCSANNMEEVNLRDMSKAAPDRLRAETVYRASEVVGYASLPKHEHCSSRQGWSCGVADL